MKWSRWQLKWESAREWMRRFVEQYGVAAPAPLSRPTLTRVAIGWLASLTLLLGPVGCSTWDPGSGVQNNESRCQDEIDAIPGVDRLRAHMQIAMSGSRTPAMLSDRSRPDKAQRAAILEFDRVKMACQRRTTVWLIQRGTSPRLLDVLDNSAGAAHALRLQLARGEMSFGAFNQRAEIIDKNTRLAVEQVQSQPAEAPH